MASERGLLYSPVMIRALLAGAKTMTRRIMKPQPSPEFLARGVVMAVPQWPMQDGVRWFMADGLSELVKCPYGKPGDRFYVKEGTWIWCDKRPDGLTKKGRPKFRYVPVGQHVRYCADGPKPTEPIDENPRHQWKHKVARFMPKWAARIWGELTGIRVERLQAITEADAIAEGVRQMRDNSGTWVGREGAGRDGVHRVTPWPTAKMAFACLWDSINPDKPWAGDWYVWVLAFKVVKP